LFANPLLEPAALGQQKINEKKADSVFVPTLEDFPQAIRPFPQTCADIAFPLDTHLVPSVVVAMSINNLPSALYSASNVPKFDTCQIIENHPYWVYRGQV
jgi:hypothetical protein